MLASLLPHNFIFLSDLFYGYDRCFFRWNQKEISNDGTLLMWEITMLLGLWLSLSMAPAINTAIEVLVEGWFVPFACWL